MGVVAAVHLARAGLGVDAIAFADEEGHYGSFIGSRSFTGLLDDSEIDTLKNRYHGKPLRQALAEAGLADKPRLQIEEQRYCGFLEMHIEQGTTLESADERVGVVSGIVAIWQYRLIFEGSRIMPRARPWRSGATPGSRRSGCWRGSTPSSPSMSVPAPSGPAATSRSRLVRPASSRVGRRCCSNSATSRPDVLVRLDTLLQRAVQESNRRERCRATLEVISQSRPAICDEGLQNALAGAAETLVPGSWQYMPSGAGHDAQYLSRKVPSAMLFVPSIGRHQPPLDGRYQRRRPRDGVPCAVRRRKARARRLKAKG